MAPVTPLDTSLSRSSPNHAEIRNQDFLLRNSTHNKILVNLNFFKESIYCGTRLMFSKLGDRGSPNFDKSLLFRYLQPKYL